ncbi:MAG: hypothetical protein R6V85_19830 [Polyangia bacterium]
MTADEKHWSPIAAALTAAVLLTPAPPALAGPRDRETPDADEQGQGSAPGPDATDGPTAPDPGTVPAPAAPPPPGSPQAPAGPTRAAVGPPPLPEGGSTAAPPVYKKDPRDGMDMGFDIGAGLLEFFHLDVALLISREWVVGIGGGSFPIDRALSKAMGTDDLESSAQSHGFEITGKVRTKLGSGRLFGRWLPWSKRFFTEATLEVWSLEAMAKGVITDTDAQEDLSLEATARVWVPMIGLHAGWRFLWENGAFLDLAGGLNLLLSPGAEVELGGSAIAQLEELDPRVRDTVEKAQRFMSTALEDGANRVAVEKIRIFPTLAIRFGWAFDFW